MVIIIVLMVLISAIYFLLQNKIDDEWTSPIFVCGLFWLLLTFCSYFVLAKDYEWGFRGIVWIYVNLFAFLLAYYFGKGDAANRNINDKKENIKYPLFVPSNISWIFIKILVLLGIIKWVYEVWLNGFHITDFTNMNSLTQMNNTVAVARYSGGSAINVITQILNVAVYAAPACGGFAFVFARNIKEKSWAIFTLLPMLLVMLFTNTKATLIGGILLWILSFLNAYYFALKKSPKIGVKLVIRVIFVGAVFLGITVFSMMLRIGILNWATYENVIKKYIIYAFGEIQSFDIWLSNYYDSHDFSFGIQTFLGIFNTLGLANRVQGVYITLPGAASNVYTVFRGVIEDFGAVLGTIYIAVHGVISGYCRKRLKCSYNIPAVSCMLLLVVDFFFLYGYIVSPWSYLSYILAVLVFGVYLFIANGKSLKIVLGSRILWN